MSNTERSELIITLEICKGYIEYVAKHISDNTPPGTMLTRSIQRLFDLTCSTGAAVEQALENRKG